MNVPAVTVLPAAIPTTLSTWLSSTSVSLSSALPAAVGVPPLLAAPASTTPPTTSSLATGPSFMPTTVTVIVLGVDTAPLSSVTV